ncbi:hypothetical protein ACOT81_20820 [Streptomyces sp. WI04-05B]|uniref:hypothetical protein n=1 Tax=Streptomyces TaxID=1883 RepID=UPI0029BBDFE4|nr:MULTISPECIES: hypothetical protein [unclassified Streptomyces]MDX2549157.1 hypothetical protein [Streptomyces sp. WI04-05B]MDX2590668.1 hypothetical protein [Streptomyces sp. WI04-05A]
MGAFEESPMDRFARTYGPLLEKLGLSAEAINGYTLSELEQALIRINEAIRHPDQFGTMTHRAGTKSWIINAESEAKIGILPILLDRKRLILERMKELRSKERIGGLQELIEQLTPGPERDALKQQVAELVSEVASVREQERATAEAGSEAQALVVEGWQKEREAKEAATEKLKKFRDEQLFKEEIAERKWNRRVAREPIATLVGALLLIVLTAVFVVSMFVKAVPSTLLSNSFLIILGYFFGQNTNTTLRERSDAPRKFPRKKNKINKSDETELS